MLDVSVAIDDPRRDDVARLLQRHFDYSHSTTPREDAHVLSPDRLLSDDITLVSARVDGRLVGVGALRELTSTHGEIKSMHTASEARGQGVGKAMLAHLLSLATERGYSRVSLETSSKDEYAPARGMYSRAGFVECDAFGSYPASPGSTFMTVELSAEQISESVT